MNLKKLVGEKAAEYVKDGMTVGLGTGSTAYWATQKLGTLVKKGLQIRGVPTSKNTEELANELGIELLDISQVERIDVTIDGADEVDTNKNLIKGGGGALLREKLIASITDYYIIVVDFSKKVETLGEFSLPIEVTPFAHEITKAQLHKFGCAPSLRMQEGTVYITDNRNFIYDCYFGPTINDPNTLADELNKLPGVVENGLFVNMADLVLYSNQGGEVNQF